MTKAGAGRRIGTALAALSLLGIAACSSSPPFAANGSFALERFFEGASSSRGEIRTLFFWTEDFTAGFAGTVSDGRLALDETFHFEAGDRLQRWSLQAMPGGRYAGTVRTTLKDGTLGAPVPVTGYKTPDGAVLDYDGNAPGGGETRLHFRHVMQAQGDGTVSNEVRISKFGLPIAGASVVFTKTPGA